MGALQARASLLLSLVLDKEITAADDDSALTGSERSSDIGWRLWYGNDSWIEMLEAT